MADPVTLDEFSKLLDEKFGALLEGQDAIAVGVSGGPDSLALVKLLSDWAAVNDGPAIHALVVDHGLRVESEGESYEIKLLTKEWPKVESYILTWEDPSDSRIQEEARDARYELMAMHCQENDIAHLFLGHHQDDQAETFLFRLAKGSGLDGLAAMKDVQERGEITLLRPLLEVPKARLVATCEAHGLEYLQDPSNESEAFARVRLRQSIDVLEEEGLTPKRLSKTAERLARASDALEEFTQQAMEKILLSEADGRMILNTKIFSDLHPEIAVRGVLWCFDRLLDGEEHSYGPRMEKVEDLAADLIHPDAFRKRTLGGLIFERNDKENILIIQREKP